MTCVIVMCLVMTNSTLQHPHGDDAIWSYELIITSYVRSRSKVNRGWQMNTLVHPYENSENLVADQQNM